MKRLLLILSILLPLVIVSCEDEPVALPENTEKPDESQDNDKDDPDNGSDEDDAESDEGENNDEGNEGEESDNENVEPPVSGTVEVDRLYGYAQGTTGGEGGKVHHFDDGDKFREWLKAREKAKSTEPAVVWLSGTFTKDNGRDSSSPWFDIKRTHNLSIYGTDGFRMQNVGFFLNEASNIIIRNIHIVQPKADNGADAISIQESHGIWVDHCTFESVNQTKDYEDGSCDVTHQSYDVTISWCHFIKTQKSCLVGHSNNATADEVITVTMHHNHFDLSSSRHPRVRFGRAHVYNNFFDGCSTYGVGSAYGAKVLVEYNLFDGVRLPVDICTFPAKKSGSSWVSNLTGSVAGYVYERENEFLNRPSDASDPYPFTNLEYKSYGGEKLSEPLTYDDFKPGYEYIVDETENLASVVSSGAGAGNLPGFAQAPVEVDNGGLGSSDGDSGSGDDSGDDSDDDSGDGSGDDEDSGDEGQEGEDLGGGWTSVACGGKTVSTVVENGNLSITANGKFESSAQSFGYVYREVEGDFEAVVKLVSYMSERENNQGLAGILMTSDISAESADFLYALSGRNQSTSYYSFRLSSGAKTSKGEMPSASGSGDIVLKLRREGNDCYVSYSADGGTTFGSEKKNSFDSLPDKVYVGLAANSANNSDTATAVFTGFALDGESISF